MVLAAGLLIPFIGTLLGASCVFLLKDALPRLLEKLLLGFASGVMIAASVWSLLIPSMNQSEHMGKFAFVPAAVGFVLGILFLLAVDRILPHLHLNDKCPEGMQCNLRKSTMLMLAVTLHNIPEGMAVGVTLAAFMSGETSITLAGAMALSIGIALQNFPEGAVISMPLRSETGSRRRAFLSGAVSGVVEPIGAAITILLTSVITPILPYLLSFAAGSMVYVVVEELLPEASEGSHSNISTMGFAAGFLLMMILDVALG